MPEFPELDVVVVNYNSGEGLKKCLNHFMQGVEVELNIYVVDNHSNDESLKFFDRSYQTIELVKNPSNLGFAKACNQGSKLGRATQLAFINPDCFINQRQLAQLSAGLSSNQTAGLVGCRVLNDDSSLQAASRRRLPTFWRTFWHLTGLSKWRLFKGINIKDSGKFTTVQTVEAVNGACILMKREAFEQLGGFDEGYPLHFEDLDLFTRLQTEGFSIIYDSSVEVKHLKGQSIQDNQKIKTWKRAGLLRYFSKHRPRWEYLIAKWLLGSK